MIKSDDAFPVVTLAIGLMIGLILGLFLGDMVTPRKIITSDQIEKCTKMGGSYQIYHIRDSYQEFCKISKEVELGEVNLNE